MKYRRFKLRELEQLSEIEEVSFEYPLSKIALILMSVLCEFFVVEEDNCVVGCLILGHRDKQTARIVHLVVKESQRGRGIAKALIEKYIDKPCIVSTPINNKEAIEFYTEQGYKETGTVKNEILLRCDR